MNRNRHSGTMSEEDLLAALDHFLDDSELYTSDEYSSDRESALRFMEGEVDIVAPEGRSKVVSRDMSDVHGMILPSILRIFFSSDKVVKYEATRPEHEDYTDDATDYVNYAVMDECAGYKHFYTAIYEGLSLGNGIIKHWWDKTPVYRTEEYTGVTQEEYFGLLQDSDVLEVIEEESYQDPEWQPQQNLQMPGMEQMAEEPPMLYDITLRYLEEAGRLKLRAVPDEYFLIDRNALYLDEDALFCAELNPTTRSDLIRQGYDPEVVADLPSYETHEFREERWLRAGRYAYEIDSDISMDQSTERVDVYECYPLVDFDGDGIAERRKVVIAGNSGRRTMLSNEEWGDDLPYSDFMGLPRPFVWRGKSLYDLLADVQRIKSVVLRGILDSAYQTINPQYEVEEDSVLNEDELINPHFGGVLWKRRGTAPVNMLEKPFIGNEVMPMLGVMDDVAERRTGISKSTMALDMDALQNQSATAVNAAQAAVHSKVEEYARNLQEFGGFKRTFSCVLKLIIKHQDRPKWVRVNGKLTQIDPRDWDDRMAVAVNTGLGTGSRERDLTALMGIAEKQAELLMQIGPFGVNGQGLTIAHYFETLRKMVEAAGIRNSETYFPVITQEMLQQAQQMQAQNQQQDPKVMETQAKMQLEQMKAQSDLQIAQKKAEIETQQKNQEMALKAQLEREKAEYQRQMEEVKLAKQAEIEDRQASSDIAVKEAESRLTMQLEREKAELQMTLLIKKAELEHQVKLRDMEHKHAEAIQDLQFNEAKETQKLEAEAAKASIQKETEDGQKED